MSSKIRIIPVKVLAMSLEDAHELRWRRFRGVKLW